MPKRTSRVIIWQHAMDYGWGRRSNLNGDLWTDRFARRNEVLIVRFAKNGRVLHAERNCKPLLFCTRGDVMDALEAWAQRGNLDA